MLLCNHDNEIKDNFFNKVIIGQFSYPNVITIFRSSFQIVINLVRNCPLFFCVEFQENIYSFEKMFTHF